MNWTWLLKKLCTLLLTAQTFFVQMNADLGVDSMSEYERLVFEAEANQEACAPMETESQFDGPSLDKEQQHVLNVAMRGANMLITGGGGTGKSYLIKLIEKALTSQGKTYSVTASTAIAALNIGGATAQSTFGINLMYKCTKPSPNWQKDVVIIDECSMIPPELLVAMDKMAREARGSNDPFGGVQFIFVGDFLQLPPVQKGKPEFTYIFETPLWKSASIVVCMLTNVYRQNDRDFIAILNRIRVGAHTQKDIETLIRNEPSKSDICPTRLQSRTADVQAHNKEMLARINADMYVFNPVITPKSHGSVHSIVQQTQKDYPPFEVCIGAQVLLTRNLSADDGLVNGARGVVRSMTPNGPTVEFPHKRLFTIRPHQQDLGPVVVTYMPLMLAWSISIHRSQGLSIDRLHVSGRNAFANGQIYVALSRARTLDGLKAENLDNIKVCPKALKFYMDIRRAQDSA